MPLDFYDWTLYSHFVKGNISMKYLFLDTTITSFRCSSTFNDSVAGLFLLLFDARTKVDTEVKNIIKITNYFDY